VGAFSKNTLHSVGRLEPFKLVILVPDVPLDQIGRDVVASSTDIIAIRPEFATPMRASQLRAVRSKQLARGDALDHVHHRGWRIARWAIHKQVYVVRLNRQCLDNPFPLVTHFADQFLEPRSQAPSKDRPSVAGNPDEVLGQALNSMGTARAFISVIIPHASLLRQLVGSHWASLIARLRRAGFPPRRKQRGFQPRFHEESECSRICHL
jgi:hypothetical protein